MARDARRRKKQAPVVELNLSEQEARERTLWLLYNFDLCTGKYLSTPPWLQTEAEKASGGDGA